MPFASAMVYGEGQLAFLLPGVQAAERALRSDAKLAGIEYKVADFGGARTSEIVEQLLRWRDQAVNAGQPTYRVSPFARTKHARGAAFDVRVIKRPPGMSLDTAYSTLARLALPHGLEWGGKFGNPADPYHFESRQSLDQLDARWRAWINSPDYPRMGYADWSVIVLLALALLYFLLTR